jgi:DNA-binding MarR family transcriptional regulator
MRLKKIDRLGMTIREVLTIYAVIHKPGMNGMELIDVLNIKFRSSVQASIRRLVDQGYIADRRTETGTGKASNLQPTEKGIAFWNEIKL